MSRPVMGRRDRVRVEFGLSPELAERCTTMPGLKVGRCRRPVSVFSRVHSLRWARLPLSAVQATEIATIRFPTTGNRLACNVCQRDGEGRPGT